MSDSVVSPQEPLSKSIPPLATIVSAAVIIFFVWAFFSRISMQFYASFLFFFYSFTHSMWISVVLLGVFQTFLLIPFRIINIIKSQHIKDFKEAIAEGNSDETATLLVKKKARSGNRIMLYSIVNFVISVVSYTSIGRLFLTDFYSKKLDPWLLYDFVKYPDYPLKDIWFKIPYIRFEDTKDLGLSTVFLVWIGIIVLVFLFGIFSRFLARQNIKINLKNPLSAVITGSSLLVFVISYFLVRNFPTSFSLAIFTGDISRPYPTFNLITAIATFFTLFWLDIPTIIKKGELAEKANIDSLIIRKTQSKLFGESLRSAGIVGLGAYYVTNLIPCAFELSIFTLEIISWLSPLTLDRLILKTKLKKVPETPSPSIPSEEKKSS